MPGVTISAAYGAGGSIIAPEVARQLGFQLLDRAISSHVAAKLQVSVSEAEGAMIRRPLVDRFLSVLAPLAGGVLGAGTDGTPHDVTPPPDEAAFCEEPGVLRVRLFGPAEARIAQAARIEDVDVATARQRLPHVDRARAQYVRRLYCVNIDDPEFYQLQVDSTAMPLQACADL